MDALMWRVTNCAICHNRQLGTNTSRTSAYEVKRAIQMCGG
jgi:hypothetical protein